MGLFIEKEENSKKIHVYQKKFVNTKTVIGYMIFYVFILPLMTRLFAGNTVMILSLAFLTILTIFLGAWFAFEKAYYSTIYRKKYEKQGKKVTFQKNGLIITK